MVHPQFSRRFRGFVRASYRRRTYYGVTPERVVIISGLFARRVKSVNIDTISDITLTERAGGAGTITLGPVPPAYGWWAGANFPVAGMTYVPTLELPDAAREVYEVIRGAQRAAKGRG
ncbi:MAG: PH domain-containing protein [Gemmataceae bacterium]|nr:PH domain-containing protein [Gemmataceae bacterium]